MMYDGFKIAAFVLFMVCVLWGLSGAEDKL